MAVPVPVVAILITAGRHKLAGHAKMDSARFGAASSGRRELAALTGRYFGPARRLAPVVATKLSQLCSAGSGSSAGE